MKMCFFYLMPYVRDIWPEYKTRWWPKAMLESERV